MPIKEMAVKKISPMTVEKIRKAEEEAEDLIQEGTPPIEALAKSANKYNLTKEQGHLLVRGWNTSQMCMLLEKSSSLDERLATVDVVNIHDFDQARSRLSGSTVSDDPVTEKEAVWSGYYRDLDFSPPPPPYFKEEKIEDPGEFSRLCKTADTRIRIKVADVKNTLKIAKENLDVLYDDLVAKIRKIRDDVFSSGLDPEIVKENLKVANYKGYKIFTLIEDTLIKRADYRDYPYYDEKKIPYSTIRDAVIALDRYIESSSKFKKLADIYDKCYSKLEVDFSDHPDLSRNLVDPTLVYPGGFYTSHNPEERKTLLSRDDVADLHSGYHVKSAQGNQPPLPIGPPGSGSGSGSGPGLKKSPKGNAIGGKGGKPQSTGKGTDQDLQKLKDIERLREEVIDRTSESLRKTISELGQLKFREEIEDIAQDIKDQIIDKFNSRHVNAVTKATRNSLILTKMITSDEVLSNYPPHKVQEAYTYLHQLAPKVMENPVTAREFVKKYLEQGETLDTYDMKLLVDMESRLRRIRISDEE